MARLTRGEAGPDARASAAQYDDGGLISRSPAEQMLLVDRLGLLRAAYFAAKQTLARRARERRRRGAGRASWRHAGRRRACRAGRAAIPAMPRAPRRADRGLRPSRPPAAPGARLGLSAAERARHGPRARRRAAAAAAHGRRGLRLDPGLRDQRRRAAAGRQLRRPRAAADRRCRASWSTRCAPPRRIRP